ncbi:uncharacterized protein LOC132182033 [Corylus avellana]|uniref:uncharacterized protein LOC132182033 n=1 Tax=Corylus avellana TaxID=13451 RepID=UPI00286A292B|nr:uncharacterized protein LOC132182033 [Corylus avellana]
MAEDLPQLWEKFTLTEDEDLEFEIPREKFQELASRGQACIVGKLLTDRLVSKEIVKDSLSRWWKPMGGLSFKVIGDNLFLIDFTNKEGKERVLASTPWVFERSLFLIKDFDGTFAPSEFTFDHAAFWVRMRNLPLACMGREIGQMIGASVRVVEAIDTDGEGLGWGESLRVKILLDLTEPLLRGQEIKLQGAVRWITFQYERLPKRFCYNCGVIIHGKAGCTHRSSFRHQEQEYGPWLRAASPTRLPERNQGRNSTRGSSNQGNAGRGEYETHWDRDYQKNNEQYRADSDGDEGGSTVTDFPKENANHRFQNNKGRGGGINHGVLDGKKREGERLQRNRYSQGNEGEPDYNVSLGEDLRAVYPESRATKKGKWDEEARNLSLHDSPRHVGSKTVNGSVEKFSIGPNGIMSSPMNSQTFRGPTFSEVEKTMQAKWEKTRGRVETRFRYEASWSLDAGYDEVIKEAWCKPTIGTWGSIGENLRHCQEGFLHWQQGLHGNLHGNIKKLQQRLSRLHDEEGGETGHQLNSTKAELQLLMDKQDLIRKQRAKTD